MLAFLAAWLAGAGAADAGDVAALERTWSGVRDSSEQVVMSPERGAARWHEASEQRVRQQDLRNSRGPEFLVSICLYSV